MNTNTTIVTAFFDINREEKGDGRKINEYLEWIKQTLQLNCNLYIVTEKKFVEFMEQHRPIGYNTFIKEDIFENASYYKYLPRIKEILESDYYKNKIAYPTRVECVLPEYNVIQYSKFGWLEEAIKANPFNSEYFFWMDAGISRFFMDVDLRKQYPGQSIRDNIYSKKFIIQSRNDLNIFNIDEQFIWKADNLLKGGMFGGYKDTIQTIIHKIEYIFVNEMLNKNNVNNEQLALALLYKNNKDLFYIYQDYSHNPLKLFKHLSF